jgi:hypothetical protein
MMLKFQLKINFIIKLKNLKNKHIFFNPYGSNCLKIKQNSLLEMNQLK